MLSTLNVSKRILQSQHDYIREWGIRREQWLSVILSLESPPGTCNGCNRPALWRCLDCQSSSPSCAECCRVLHQRLIFHRVQFWTGEYYEPSWLLHTGLILHLGHQGNPCPCAAIEVPADNESVAGVADGPDTDEAIGRDVGDPAADENGDWIDLPDENSQNELHQEIYNTSDPFLVSVDPMPISVPAGSASTTPPAPTNNMTSAPATPSAPDDPFAQTRKKEPLRLSSFANVYGPPSGCKVPLKEGAQYMTIIDRSGVHRMRVELCHCPGAELQREMHLLHAGLFPASFKIIKTTFTFAVLDDFRLSNLDCKTSGYHYYRKLRRLTSPSFPDAVPVSSNLNEHHRH